MLLENAPFSGRSRKAEISRKLDGIGWKIGGVHENIELDGIGGINGWYAQHCRSSHKP
jgi:hypothetical protein